LSGSAVTAYSNIIKSKRRHKFLYRVDSFVTEIPVLSDTTEFGNDMTLAVTNVEYVFFLHVRFDKKATVACFSL
jgi:hypothetical protein